MYEATPGFATSEKAAGCPRLCHRGGAPAQAAPTPALLARLKLPAGAPVGKVRAALNKKDGYGNLPIHCALCDAATGPELVRAMLDAGGEAMLAVPGQNKRLPLHFAASNSPSPAVVEILLTRGPAGALRAENGDGSTPLDYAWYNRGPAAAEIKALLRAAMQCARMRPGANLPKRPETATNVVWTRPKPTPKPETKTERR
jgi:hypothetical protein